MNRRGPGCGCFGCGGSFLLTLVVLGVLVWFVVLKPAKDFIAGWQSPQTQSQTARIPAPTGNVSAPMNRADLEKFVRVRRDVRQALGTSFTPLQTLLNDMNSGKTPGVMEVLGVLKDTASSVGAARTAQATALGREKMSLERYAALRSEVNRALGLPNINLAKVAGALQKGQLPDLGQDVKTATAQEEALIKPFESELRVTAAAGLLGL